LIVDDEPKVAFFLRKALQCADQNYKVSVAGSGEAALALMEKAPVDLLVTDLRMPGISGLDLIRRVRQTSPQTRTILITAYGNKDVVAESRRLEAYRYISKPFDIGDFTRTVQEALRDVAVSEPGFLVLSDDCFEVMTDQLDALRYDIGAQCVFLADMQGQLLAQVGQAEGVRSGTLLALLAGGFATSMELARQLGDDEAVDLNFHEGARYEIYSINVGDNLFMAILYDRRVQASRVGIVWLYARRAVEKLLDVLSSPAATSGAQALDTDFSSSLMAELDTLFDEDAGLQEEVPAPEVDAPPSPPTPPSAEDVGDAEEAEPEPLECIDFASAVERGLIPADLLDE
jgi:DNA-binding response OmpR family regulator